MKMKFEILTALIIILSGCAPNQSNEKIKTDNSTELKYPYTFIEQIGKQIDYSLSQQDNNVKEIRIWIKVELLQPNTLIELKERDNATYQKWIHYNYTRKNRIYKLDSLTLYNRISDNNIDSIIYNLNRLGFDKVQSQPDSIKDMIGDGITYVIEIKKDGYYKAIDCNMPQIFEDSNNKKLVEILNYLSKTIGFYYNENEK
jgi:hypothetical protein